MLKFIFLTAIIFVNIFCNSRTGDQKAFGIIEKCIDAHGGDNYRHLDVSFDYRQFRMHLMEEDGIFLYGRTMKDSLNNTTHDELSNDGFRRELNGNVLQLSQADNEKYKNGLNAIAYFALLPYKLSEPAVVPTYLGDISFGDTLYRKVHVEFKKESGGKDHDDVFCFWINSKTNMLDFLAYSNGGPRFRKVINRINADGVVFQDYENYQILDTLISSDDYDKAFMSGKAKLLSVIKQDHYSE